MSVLLVDGDNLLTIGFYGCKNYFYKGNHIGGIFHFLNTLRKSFETYHLNKIVVFWDGENGAYHRKKIYPEYKSNRKDKLKTEEEISSYNYQRDRIKQYLEELYVRQGEFELCESDDCIAYYTQNSKENKIIYSSDGDLTQLISDNTQIYNPSHQKLYKRNDIIQYQHQEVLIENVKIIKIFCGDYSDNITGIRNLGIKRFLGFFPEIKEKELTINEIIEKSNNLFDEDKKNKTLANILTGVTKYGVFGDEFLEINDKIVNLTDPFLTDEAKNIIHLLITDNLDPEGRSYKNTLKMMINDGLFNVLPKSDNAWITFLNPFLRLTRKEKNNNYNFNKMIKIRNHEQ
jgi:5'-3' exonuclease